MRKIEIEIEAKIERAIEALSPEAISLARIAKARKGQGSLEYIMMLAAASIVIVLALAMIVKLKGAVISNVTVNGNSMSISQAIASQLTSISSNTM